MKKIEKAIFIITMILLFWVFASFVDVNLHHITGCDEYSALNLFELINRYRV